MKKSECAIINHAVSKVYTLFSAGPALRAFIHHCSCLLTPTLVGCWDSEFYFFKFCYVIFMRDFLRLFCMPSFRLVPSVPDWCGARTHTLFLLLSSLWFVLYPWCGAWWCACGNHCLWSSGTYSTVIFVDTSATDTDPEEPANALASLGRKPVQPKSKGSKQRRVSKAGARLLKTGRLAKAQQLKREKKLKLTKKEKENMKDVKKQKVCRNS